MPIPLAVPLIAGGIGAAASWWGGRKAKQGARRESDAYGKMAGDMERRQRQAAEQSSGTRNQFMEAATAARDFDPSAYMDRAAGSMMENLGEEYNQITNARVGNLNRRGLFQSDIGGAKQQRHLNSRIANALGGLSMQGAQMRQGAQSDYARTMGGVYGADRDQENQFLDAAMGLRGAQVAGRAAGDQAGAEMWGNIGGSLLGAAGGSLPHTRWGRRW